MIYKRGGQYWYKFRWTLKVKDAVSENYLIRKSARTTNRKKAGEAEEEHRRALRLGQIHPSDVWPKPKPQEVQIPTLRTFSDQFTDYVMVQKKAGTARFYGVAKQRLLEFSPLGECIISEITGE